MSTQSKVVHLNQARNADASRLQAQLPLPLIKLRDTMSEEFKTLLRQMFDNTDDALFELADRAGSNVEQALYFDAMREVRLKRKHLELSFMQSYSRAFLSLGQETPKRQAAADINLDSLSLLQNDELEERVAIENMVNKVKNRLGNDLQHLTIRIDCLMGNIRVEDEQNPFGPQVLCEAFVSACKGLEADIRAKLIVMKLFDKFVLSRLQDVYEKANKLLIEQGVMPDLKVVKRQNALRSPVYRSTPATVDGNSGQVVTEPGNPEVLGFLQELMAEQRALGNIPTLTPIAGASMGGQSGVNLPMISQGDLMSLLSVVQHQLVVPGASLPGAAPSGHIDMRLMLQDMLQRGGKPSKVSQLDEDVINLVSMLFEFILNDRQLPATMKALIARLQIPMLKVAIADKSFFGKSGHPARRLLNELATAAIGWNEKPEGEADPLREKVEGIVHQLVNDFEDNLQIFDSILVDFQKFVQTEQRRGQLVEQRTRDAEEGRAKSELARRQVQEVLNEILAGRAIPEVVLTLLRDGWSNLLVLHFLKHGTDSEEWRNSVQLARDLVWSVCPPEDRSARSQLLQMIPPLLKGLREGLSVTSFSPFEMDRLLKELEGLHVKALQRMSVRAQVPAARPAPEAAAVARADNPVTPQPNTRPQGAAASQVSVTPQVTATSAEPVPAAAKAQAQAVQTDDLTTARPVSALAQVAEETPASTEEPQPPVIIIDELAADSVAGEPNFAPAAVSKALVEETAASVSEAAASLVAPEEAVLVEEIVLVAPDTIATETFEDADDECLRRVDGLHAGCWVEFHEEAGKKFRAKLAAILQTTGKYIFVNRTGVKVAEKTRMGLAVELRRGTVSLLDDGLLFDRALEAVIGNLRNVKRA